MNKYAVMVDAGYLLASMARVLTGSSNRNMIQVSWEKLVQQMKQEIDQLQQSQSKNSELLRVQWYDSPPEEYEGKRQAEEAFLAIDGISRTKTRIGRTSFGNQKGVDVKLALDIVNLSMRGLVTDLYLVSGDDDLTEAVELAQDYGVRVHLYNVGALEDSPVKTKFGLYSTATNLARRADERHIISADLIKRAATIVPQPLPEEEGDAESRSVAAAKIAGAAAEARSAAEAFETPAPAIRQVTPAPQVSAQQSPAQQSPAQQSPVPMPVPAPQPLPAAKSSAPDKPASRPVTPPVSAPVAPPKTTPAPRGPITPKLAPVRKQEITYRPPAPGAELEAIEREATEALHAAMKSVVRQTVISLVTVGRVESLIKRYQRPNIPSDIDRGLLLDVCLAMGEPDMDIASKDRAVMRGMFWDEIDRLERVRV